MPANVSIIIPTKNRGELLQQTLASVQAQTHSDWECIIVDDHSSDKTSELTLPILNADKRIRMVQLGDNQFGAQAARNLGIQLATTNYIILLDSDDLLAPHCLAQRIAFMEQHPELDFAVYPCEIFLTTPGDKRLLWNIPTTEPDLDRFLRNDVPWQTTSPIWRKTSLDKVGPWDVNVPVAQDWEFHIRAIIKGMKYVCTGITDHYWRMADSERESIGKSGFQPPLLRARVGVNEKVLQQFKDANLLTDNRRKYFAGLYFLSADRIARRISRKEGRSVWRSAYDHKLISAKEQKMGDRALFLLKWKTLGEMARRGLEKSLPAEYFVKRSGTFLNSPRVDPAWLTKTPAISVVMSVYNNARYLRQAMDSIVTQTFGDFEFIIVDDGSTDDSLNILKQYAARDPRIQIIARGNKGLTVSLNEALRKARAPIIARMDGDDASLSYRFERQIKFLNEHPEVVLLGASVELVDPYTITIGNVEYPTDHDAIDARLLKGEGGCIPHPVCMYRKEGAEKIGYYKEHYNNSEDLDFFLRMAEVGKVANLPDILLKYRRDLGSVSHTKRDNQLRMKSTILNEAYDRRGLTKPATWTFDTWMPKPPAEQLLIWGWKAIKVKNPTAAQGHAKELLKLRPWSILAWKLWYCAKRGR